MMRVVTGPALALLGVLLLAVAAAAQSPDPETAPCCQDMWNPGWMQRDMWGPGGLRRGMQKRMERHWTFINEGVPAAYRDARNPLPADAATIGEGRTLYRENCERCHGTRGMGDGREAYALNPSPALLAYLIQTPLAVDPYMLWSISDGGTPFETDMPVFREKLAEDDIWRIVRFMRAGFPADPAP